MIYPIQFYPNTQPNVSATCYPLQASEIGLCIHIESVSNINFKTYVRGVGSNWAEYSNASCYWQAYGY